MVGEIISCGVISPRTFNIAGYKMTVEFLPCANPHITATATPSTTRDARFRVSMAVVASRHPHARIVGFDRWIPNYVGMENPGPEFVQKELECVGYQEKVEFITGDSKKTVPAYFRQHPDAYFDVITVDGDHSAHGARVDLRHVIPRLKIGGFLVFDDEDPALAIAVLVDFLRSIGERVIDFDDLARHGRKEVGNRFDRLHRPQGIAGLHLSAHLRKLHVDHIAELRLGVLCDPYRGVVPVHTGPLVLL